MHLCVAGYRSWNDIDALRVMLALDKGDVNIDRDELLELTLTD